MAQNIAMLLENATGSLRMVARKDGKMVRKVLHIRQRFETRPIVIYTELTDLTETDFENVKKIQELYTQACEVRFKDVLKKAIDRYAETGEVPTLDIAMEDFDNGK